MSNKDNKYQDQYKNNRKNKTKFNWIFKKKEIKPNLGNFYLVLKYIQHLYLLALNPILSIALFTLLAGSVLWSPPSNPPIQPLFVIPLAIIYKI